MSKLGNGLYAANHDQDALSVREAELAMERRLGADEDSILATQSNLSNTYAALGRIEEATRMARDVYSGRLKLSGEEHEDTVIAANNYADSLRILRRFKEAKALLRKLLPVARRVLGEADEVTLNLRRLYAMALL